MNNIIFFGPPGAGKGTQAKIISEYLTLPHLSTGEILRSKIKKNDPLALELKEIMANGKLVSDEILNKIVFDELDDCKNGFILDGYPRTIDQSNFLNNNLIEKNLNLNFIFNINLDYELLKQRIIKRSFEEKREDDSLNVIKTRYVEYVNSTQKVSEYYKSNNPEIFFEINGDKEIDEITYEIKKIVEKTWKSANIQHISSWRR